MFQSGKTYFSELIGHAWLLVMLFAGTFYLLCFLQAKHSISAGQGSVIVAIYWVASALQFTKRICDSFAQFYRAILTRMRLYTVMRRFFQWYLGCTVLTVPFLFAVLARYVSISAKAFQDWSIKPLVAAYGASLALIILLFSVISNVVARSRGTRSSRLSVV